MLDTLVTVWTGSASFVRFRLEPSFASAAANDGFVPLLPAENTFGGRSSDRLAKINERLKLGKPGRALNGALWVELSSFRLAPMARQERPHRLIVDD